MALKRFGARPFNKDTVTAMLRNQFYAAYAPGDDRGTVKYKEQRFPGLHPAAFTYDEWQKIRAMTQSMYRASTRTEQVKHVYQFAGYISCIHCGLPLRCDTGNTPDNRRAYYRDAAKARRIPCPTGGNLMVRISEVHDQFGVLLKSLTLPENWREHIRRNMVSLILQPEGLYYGTELRMIAALKPQPAFLPVLRMLAGVVEYEETSGLLVTEHWSYRNQRVSAPLSPTFTLFMPPDGKLYLNVTFTRGGLVLVLFSTLAV